MKNLIEFTSTMKPSGSDYKKITYWNRFYRTKLESIITFGLALLALIYAIYTLIGGRMNVGTAIICLILIFYPVFIISQFNASIKSHLASRDPAEDAPCRFSLMGNGILMEITGFEDSNHFYKYEEFTSVYLDVFGFFMMFIKDKPVVVIRRADIPAEELESFEDTLVTSVSEACKVQKF